MKRDPAATRARILQAAYALFYRRGFHRTSLDDIAAKAGVTKRTLYYHVRSKDELAGAMLSHRHDFVLDQVARWIGAPARGKTQGRPAARRMVRRLFDSLARWADSDSRRARWTGSGFTRIALELADLPGHPARAATRLHKAKVEEALAQRLAECGVAGAEARAAQIQMLLEGAMLMTLISGDPARARLAGRAAEKLV